MKNFECSHSQRANSACGDRGGGEGGGNGGEFRPIESQAEKKYRHFLHSALWEPNGNTMGTLWEPNGNPMGTQ